MGDRAEFLINIIVRARNEIAGIMQKAATDVDRVTKAQERGAAQTKKYNEQVTDAQKRFETFSASVEKGEQNIESTAKSMKAFGQEFDRLARRAKPGTEMSQSLQQLAQTARMAAVAAEESQRKVTATQRAESDKRISQTKKEAKVNEDAAEALARARRRAAADSERAAGAERLAALKQEQAQRGLQTEIEDTQARYELFNVEVERGLHNASRAQAGYRQFATEFGRLQRSFDAGSESALEFGERQEQARGRAQDFGETLSRSGTQADRVHTALSRLFGIDTSKLDAITARISEFERTAGRSRFAVAAIDNRLRGLLVIGVIAFFQQLVGVGVALGSTLFQVAAAAGQAAIALGGMAFAAGAQAAPALGLLGAAWGRVGAVFDAVKQAQKAQTQAAYDQAQAADRSRAAARAVEGAEEAVADAHRRRSDAQQALTKANAEAEDQIEDLIEAERRAEIQALSAAEAQRNAQRTLREAVRSGDVDVQAAAEIEVMGADVGVGAAGRGLERAREDAARARRGPGAMEGVIAATRALADATRGVEDAQEALDDARDSAQEANTQVSAAQRGLEQLLAQLSPAERRLFTVTRALQERYRRLWINGVLEPIVDAFSVGVGQLTRLLGDRRIIGAANSLAAELVTQINRLTSFLSSDKVVEFFVLMGQAAEENLPIVGDILEHVADLAMSISIAAGPALTAFLEFIRDLAGEADAATSGEGGIARLREFFMQGEQFAEDFILLAVAVAELFLAISGAGGAESGATAIQDLTKQVQIATDYIREHREEVAQFFKETREATYDIIGAIWQVILFLGRLYDAEQVHALVDAFEKSLLPAIENVATALGFVISLFLEFAGTDVGSAVMQTILTGLLLFKVFTPIVTLISRMVVVFGTLISSARLVALGLGAIEIATGPIGIAFAALAAVVFLLKGDFDGLGDILKTLGIAIGVAGGAGLMARVLGLSGALGGLLSKLPGVSKLFGRGGAKGAVGGLADDFIDFTPIGRPGGAAGDAASKAGRQGGTLGRIFGSGFAGQAAKFIKGAGWLTLGVAAASGIISGFQHSSVKAGIQDFFHSVTFGLIDSFDETVKEAADRASKRLTEAIDGALSPRRRRPRQFSIEDLFGAQTTTVPKTRRELGADWSRAGIGGIPSTARTALTQAGKDLAKLREKYGGEFDGFLNSLRDNINRFRAEVSSGSALGTDAAFQAIARFAKDAPPEFKAALEQMVEDAKEQRDKLMAVFEKKRLVTELVGNLGLALQGPKANIEKIVDDFITQMKRLPPESYKQARDSAIEMARGLREKGVLTKEQADKIEEDVTAAFTKMRRRAVRRAAKMMEETNAAFGALATVASIQMGSMVTTANSILKSLGFKGLTIPKIEGPKQLGARLATPGGQLGLLTEILGAGGDAAGGWIGRMGERGKDAVPRLLGRGEAVLNWAHQAVVEPAMRAYHGFGLDEMFKRVRGEHGGRLDGGMAQGGYAQGAQESPGGTPAFIQRLFKLGYWATSAFRPGAQTISGKPSHHGDGNAWDFGDSINNLRALWRTIFASRRGFAELFGPTYVSGGRGFYHGTAQDISGTELQRIHEDHIHIAIVKGLRGAIRGIANLLGVEQIKAGKVPGDGPLSKLTQSLLDRVAKGLNRKTGAAADEGGGFGGQFRGDWVRVMRQIAETRGWNFPDWKWLVNAESGGDPEAVNPSSGAFGLGQFLGATARAYAKFGALSHDPVKQIVAMAKYIFDRYVNPTAAKAFHVAHNWYEKGGDVAGSGPVQAVLHGGEHVWTAAEVARAGGHEVMYALRSLLGGGRQSMGRAFQEGGGVFTPRDVEPNVPNLLREARRARRFIEELGNPRSGRSKFARSIQELIGDNGILDKLNAAIDSLVTRMSNALLRATFKLNESGKVIRRLGDVAVADRAVDNLQRAYRALAGERGVINRQIEDVGKRIDDIRKQVGDGRPTAEQRKALAFLRGFRRNLRTRLQAVNTSIAANLQETFEAVENAITARVDRASRRAERALGALDLVQRGRDLVGGTVLSALGAPSNAALGEQRAGILREQANRLEQISGRARRQGHTRTADDLLAQVAELRQAAVEAVAAGISSDVEEIGRQIGRRATVLDLRSRIQQALGNVAGIDQIAIERAGLLRDQINQLRAQQGAAAAAGAHALAEQIGDSIAELEVSIAEIAIQHLQTAVEEVERAAGRRSATLDLRDRLANLVDSAGGDIAAFGMRGGILRGRRGIIQDQISALEPLLGQAQAQGNVGLVERLTDQLAELRVQLQENEAAIRENTVLARQARIDQITGRGGFLTGVFGGLQGLVQAVQAVTGAVDVDTQKQLISQVIAVLGQTGNGLAQQLFEAFGVDLRGASPQRLVQLLSSLNFDQISAGFTDSQRAQFEQLINAIIENATAVQQNTEQLNALTNPTSQNWASTAWQWFRNAIFTGSGGLLPQFATTVPHMWTGGEILTSGWIHADAGERIVAANVNRDGQRGDVFAPTINNEEKTVDMDPETLSNRLAFRWRNRPKAA